MTTRRFNWIALISLLSFAAGPTGFSQAEINTTLQQVARDYTQRIESATNELNATRETIAGQKIPLLNSMRAVEDRILSLQAEVGALRIANGELSNEKAVRDSESNAQTANIAYLSGLAADTLGSLNNTLAPADAEEWKSHIEELRSRLDPTNGKPDITAVAETAELAVTRIEKLLGGFTKTGMAVASSDHSLIQGTFAFLGPETLFVADTNGGPAGPVRSRDEGAAPMVYEDTGWDYAAASALMAGQESTIPVDISGGKALQLQVSQGTWVDHIERGGPVGYTIIGLGIFALLTSLLKLVDLRRLSVDLPSVIHGVINTIAENGQTAGEKALATMRGATSRDLYTTGLRHMLKPKEIIEEHLHAFILKERLHHERWLPMLAVIAAASPLLGLLGTVVGMVKTFTLITVFGTGNAGKLSSGISEALVTTELGLIVAIPTLVLHGFLSHRTQKNLSLLERYAVEFVTATEDHKVASKDSA